VHDTVSGSSQVGLHFRYVFINESVISQTNCECSLLRNQ